MLRDIILGPFFSEITESRAMCVSVYNDRQYITHDIEGERETQRRDRYRTRKQLDRHSNCDGNNGIRIGIHSHEYNERI